MTGESGLEKLRFLARHSNKHKLIPRPAVECLADDSGSIEARLKKQTRRADIIQKAIHEGTVTPTSTP